MVSGVAPRLCLIPSVVGGLSRSDRRPWWTCLWSPLIMSQARQIFTHCLKCDASVLIRPANQVWALFSAQFCCCIITELRLQRTTEVRVVLLLLQFNGQVLVMRILKSSDFLDRFAENGGEMSGTALTLCPYIPFGTLKAICQYSSLRSFFWGPFLHLFWQNYSSTRRMQTSSEIFQQRTNLRYGHLIIFHLMN